MSSINSSISLPIDPLLPQLVKALEEKPNLILQASPGSGKTTRVPRALLECSFLSPQQEIWVLEPRRVAAKYSALRIADEMEEPIGNTVGYQFRFENKTSSKTRLKFLTEGMMMRFLLSDSSLSQVGIVVLDEFHERHLHSDTALNVLSFLQKTKRPDLRLVIMSATLPGEALAAFLDQPAFFKLEGKPHPLSIEYLSSPSQKSLELLVRDSVRTQLKAETTGDILVFLPGASEIRRSEEAVAPLLKGEKVLLLPLYGDLSKEEQDRAILPQMQRKIILSTNLAETSLTIEGVNCVIDSGLERQSSYSWWTGIPALKTRTISKASAIQRAGRAARTGPGKCIRLYTQSEFESRPAFTTPELFRSDLAQTLLELKSLGFTEMKSFLWFEAPPKDSLNAAEELLFLLGAIEAPQGAVTELGKAMSRIPSPPRIARLLLEAEKRNCLGEALHLSALILEGELEELDALDSLKRKPGFAVKRTIDHLSRFLPKSTSSSPEQLPQAVLRGFPDRLAKRKDQNSVSRNQSGKLELVFCAGGTAEVSMSAFTLHHDFFITLSAQEQGHAGKGISKTVARSLIAVEETDLLDLTPSLLQEASQLVWDKTKKRLTQKTRLCYGQLVLEEKETNPVQNPENFSVFFKEATTFALAQMHSWPEWVEALGRFQSKEILESIFGRVLLLASYQKDRSITPLDLAEELSKKAWDTYSFDFFSQLDWLEVLAPIFLLNSANLLNSQVPTHLLLPSGRKAPITYPLNRNPWVESRLQDFFGMKTTPRVLNGTIPVTVHLLAPNYRAVQVTQDLSGFWKNHYPEIRKELSRRYPKHAWPEDPSRPIPLKHR